MEHKIKRVFAFLLSIIMMINSVPVTAFATEGEEHVHTEAETLAVETTEHEHSLVFMEAKDANCTQTGNSAYWYCSAEDCSKYFSDPEGNIEISAESTVIAAGHSWDAGVVTTEATETAPGVRTYTCSCGATETEEIPMVQHIHGLIAVEAVSASCAADGNSAYWYCDCGQYFSDAEGTAEIAQNSWVIPAAHATVMDESLGYWVCTGCGQYYEDEAATLVIDPAQLTAEDGCAHSLVKTDAVEATCTSAGVKAYWTCASCGALFADEAGSTAIDHVLYIPATSGYTWDFSQNSVTSTDGAKTLGLTSYATNSNTTVPVVDGALTSSNLLAMTIFNSSNLNKGAGVTLDSEEDWVIEVVAKGDGTNQIGAVAVHGSYSVATATAVHINKYGDLSIVKKTSGVEGVTDGYNYYKVSNEDYNASALKKSDFDVTEYHNYQLRHSADGVYSFWLDGEKVGDLALTENNITRDKTTAAESTAARGDLDIDLKITYVGCGASKAYNNYGLIGSVKLYGLYTGHTVASDDGNCTTDILCADCDVVMVEGAQSHTAGEDDGDCTTAVSCTVCSTAAVPAQSHAWSETYTTSAEGHYQTCGNTGCQQSTALEGHNFGEDQTAEACTVCGYKNDSVADHTHGVEVTPHAGTDATCKTEGVKTYYECSCGKFFEEEACTTEIADLDSWKVIAVNPNAHTYAAGETTDATCLSHGETVYTCSECGGSYAAYTAAKSGTTWDFSGNTVTSTDGENTLSFVSCASDAHTTIPVANGAITTQSNVTMSLSKGITLKADQEWIVEVVAKGNGEKPISNILSTGKSMSTAIYIFINAKGDLSIGKKVTSHVGDNGTTKANAYVYYQVSDKDFNASILNSASFDVTEYHTYQLRHSADGVYSFWVDGQKIGDLSVSENGYNRASSYVSSTAPRTDLNVDLVMNYIGGGLSGNSYTNFGFLGSMSYLGLYTGHTAAADDGDCTTDVACTICGGVAIEGAENHTPVADDGDCTTDILCSVCGKVAAEGAENHTPAADDGDCTTDILCTVCGKVAVQGAENHTPNADDGDCTTDITCSICGTVTTKGAENHTPNADDGHCTTDITCSVCGKTTAAGQADHNWTATYTQLAEGHYKTCTAPGCEQHTTLEGHISSGAATIEKPETCTVCDYVIAPALEHTHGSEVTAHNGKAASCIAEGTKTYYECSCGIFYEDEACTKVIENLDSWKVIAIDSDAHSFGEWIKEIPVSCTADGTKGHKTCGLCEKNFDAEGKLLEDLTIKSEGHEYVAGETTDSTCVADGWIAYKCAVCPDSYVEKIPARTGHTWDFTQNSVISTNGRNTLSFVACADDSHTSIPIADGALTTKNRVTMSLSESITLKANQDWIVEIVAKGNGEKEISSVLSTGKGVSTATYIFINKNGDLSIGKKLTSLEGDNGSSKSNVYTYYHVSDAAYNASVLASDSFDVTEYHSYQLRHRADGVYSFWVDGEKIGDLTLTENGYNRSSSYVKSTKARTDLNVDLVMTHIGGGLASNGYTNFGVWGSIQKLGVYPGHTAAADDGDCTTDVACTICGGVAIEGAENHTPVADDGDCTTDILCSVCGKVAAEGAENHTPAADDGDCTTDILCTVCGKVAVQGAENHTPNADDGDCTTDITCSICGTVTAKGAENHAPNADDGDCTTDITCSVCGKTTAAGQADHNWTATYTQLAEGHYKTCTAPGCEQHTTLEGHISSGAATIEKPETCTVCDYVIAPALEHTHGSDVTTHAGTDATCSAEGVKTYYECSCGKFFEEEACTKEIADLDNWKVIAIDSDAHSFGEWIKEIPVSCTADGTKGHKTCGLCEKNFDAEGKLLEDLTIKSKGHNYVAGETTDATCLSHGETVYTCSECGDSYVVYAPATSGRTFDFSQNSVTSTDGKSTLTLTTNAQNTHTEVPVADGALTTSYQTAMSISDGVTLKKDADWVFEVFAKGNGTDPIGAVAVAGSYSIANSKAVGIHINKYGDLTIVKKTDGIEGVVDGYNYYKVSNEAYNASVLADDSFDVTEYHNYQLRHSAEGVYSFWLDGQKIGDLTMSENNQTREKATASESTAARPDLAADMKISYLGFGASKAYTNFGLKGSIKLHGVYTGHTAGADDGDCTTDIPCTVCGGAAIEGAEKHTPAADDGDCTTDILCTVCGKVAAAGAENHTPAADDGDCTTDILCTVCGKVAAAGAENHIPAADDGDCTTDILCTVCNTVTTKGNEKHTPAADDGDCTTAISCTVCGTETTAAKTAHTWSETYTATVEGHYQNCTVDGCQQHTAPEAHVSGGAATTESPEVCTVCDFVITPAIDHTHGKNVTTHTGFDATCSAEGAKTYYECDCDKFFEDEACTKEITDLDNWKVLAIDPDAHSFGEWIEEIPVSCEADGTKGHKTCSACEKNFDAENKVIEDLTIKSEGHKHIADESNDATCLSRGEILYTCFCGDSYVAHIPAKSGTTWDFSGNTVTSTDGENTLSFVACADESHSSIPVADGALTAKNRVTMSLSKSITLKADQEWILEAVAKGDGANPIGNIAATGKSMSTAIYVFINAKGDLSIGKKVESHVGDNGTTKANAYVYYQVSDKDFNASVLKSADFQVTDYHTYQLRHSADGVYSFWVDGQKIGNLSVTENGYNRASTYVSSTAPRTDLNVDLVMTYVGGGLSANGYTNFGIKGSMSYLGVYTGHTPVSNEGDCTKGIVCSVCATQLAAGAKSHTPAADDGDCTTDILCTACPSVAVKGNVSHSFTKNLVSDVMAKPADCENPATYYIHCDNCSVKHETLTQEVGEAKGHDWDEGVVTLPPTETAVGIRTLTCKVEGCGKTTTVDIPMLEDVVSMTYDDRMPVTELGQAGEPVISDQVVTSFKVGTETPDDNVLVYEGGKLIAVGTGTAKVTWGEASYTISVSAAPISLLMITGHSLGAGSRGVVEQSIVCEPGQVYSTHEVANAYKLCVGNSGSVTGSVDITGMGLGYSSEIRPEEIDAMTSLGDGVVGSDSAVAYQWAKLTGEKVWVLNSSIGSSQLNSWQAGGVNYKHAVMLYKTAEAILNNEVTAGHYQVNHMGVLNFSTANGDQTWIAERYTEAFNSMWNGFRSDLALYDFDGDGTKDTVDCIGILPTWGVCSVNDWNNLNPEPLAFYNTSGKPLNGKIINYVMGAIGDNGVIIASDGARSWTSDKDVKAYFAAHPISGMYGLLQNGTYHSNPTTVRGINYDGIHFNQLGYNVQGIEAATSLYKYWYGTDETVSMKLLQSDGVTQVPASVTITEGKNYVMVPAVFPLSSKVTVEITGDDVITYDSGYVTATGIGTAQITFRDMNGKALKSVTVTTEKRSEEFYEDIAWYVWDFSGQTATSTEGNNTITATQGTMSVKDGKAEFESAVAEMTTGVRLDKTNNWCVEVTLRAKTDSNGSVIDPGSLLSSYHQAASAVTVYLDAHGSMHLMRRGDIGSYTAKYWNFAVDPGTLQANLPANFDMTDYHTYQLRCTNGVFSYWLDGKKIGDLTTTYCDSVSFTGEYMDHSGFTVRYLGNGTSSNATKYGIHAVVDEIRIYADGSSLSFDVGLDAAARMDSLQVYPGSSVVLTRPNTGDYCAKFMGWYANANLTGTCYKVGDTYVVSNLTPGTLYAKWEESLSGNGSHVWGQNQNKDAIKIPADCLNPATYYTSCNECGATSAGTEWEETFVGSSIGGHSYTAEKVADRYLKEAANCDHPAIYYKSCSSCGLSSKDQAGEATFTNGVEKHSYGTPIVTDSTCISRGENQFVCADCGDIYVTYTNALSGYTWDFSNNSATSTNGSSKLSITSYSTGNKYTAVPIENGVLNAEYRTVMTLSSKPTLKADENWAIEVVAKGDGVSPIGSVATHGSYSVGNSKTVYVYIDENGDLSIGKKYAFTADNGSIPSYQFAYYKVSNADYNASVLAQDSFDVTEYHNYQLRHSADGVFSFWVDGQKIGNLALTEDGISRTNTKLVEYTGARDDLDIDLKISYIGCGDSSSGYSNMGVRGSIKLYGIYTGHTAVADDGDCTTDILCSVCKAVVTEGAKSHTPAEDDGDCTTAVLCSVCGKTAVAAQKSHTWSKTYGHTVSGHYRSCTKCGTREAEAKHISGGAATATAAETCTVCKYVITAALNHTHGTTGTIHKGSAATCVATGTKTYYACSCGKFFEDSKYTREVSDLETWIVIAVDANAHSYTGKASDVLKSEATCTEPAQYYAICDLCHMVHESEGVAVGTALGHTFTAETAEDKYLKNTPDCDTIAVYYKSCAVCGASSKGAEGEATFTTKERHNYKTDVKFGSTCLSHGETMLTCVDCGDSYVAYVPAYSGTTWDFSQGSATSTDGANTLTVFKSFHDVHTEIPLVNGTMTTEDRLTMKLSQTVTLKRSNDWTVEIVAKPNGANGIRAFLSTNFAVSSATYFYIDESGDLSIAKKYSYVSDDGISIENKFSYYKVSNEDYNASILADTSFDVNEFHNYQLRCTDGVYSFWLDGQKIGDLTLTENIAQRSDKYAEYTGPRDDLDTFKISYIGCGDGTNRAGLGLLASVKYLGIYPGHDFSDACDSTCNVAECGHVRTVTHKYTDDGDCTTATACSLCGTVIVEAKPSHSWSEDYNYNTTYHYRTCTECGKDEAKQNHVSSGSATKDKAEVCTVCGYVITAALNHIHGQVVTTHTGTPATCQDTGTKTYYECSCGKLYEDEACTKEISDLKTWSFQDLAGHSFTAEIATPKYIKSEANYETSAVYYKSCHTCGLSSAGQQGEALFQSGYPSDGYFNVISKSQWDIAPGIKETDMVLNNATEDRRQEIYIMEVDINNEYTSILPSYRKMNPTYGNYGRATMSEQASWVEKNWDLNVVGAMNTFATGYSSDYYKQNPDRITEPLGLLVINGEVYANTPTYVNGTNGPETCLVVNYDEKDGVKRPASIPKVELRDVDDGLTGWEEQVVPSLWGWLVKDGVNLSNAVDHETVNPRSVLGIKADGTIVMLVNDGRRIPYSYGMSYYELGEMMLALGCVDAINCDGGGSSTFISQRPGEALKVNSHPTNGGERATITGILAISTAPANGEFVRASVTTEHTYYTPGSTVQFNAVGVDLAGNSADIPEGATWRVTEGMGTIQNGKFVSNGTVGKVVAELVVDGNVAGSATIYVVNPDTVSFAQPTITIPNGKGAELNIVATYGIYDVKIKPEDFRFELSDSAIGTMDGLTLNATEDTSVTSGSITMTYLHDTTKVSTAKLVLGQASKVLADFDEGIGNWRGHRGPYRNQQKFDVYGVDRTNGQVRNGDGALAATADFTYSTTSSQSFFNINYGGETTTIENAQSLGFWVYVPEEVPFACLMTYFYSGDDTTQTKVETILNDENTAKTGWQYVTIDLSKHESITLKHDVVFMRVYYAMTADTSSLVPFSGLNYKATWYFDDVTVDYSVAVDDREAPVFDEVVYAASYAGLEGLVIADSYPTFEAYVTEDLTKGNATGLDTTSAKAYIDGNAVSCSYLNGTVTVNSTVALADGPHTLEVAMSDKAGNEGTIRSSFTVAAGSGIPTVKLVPHDATKDKLLMGSQYWVDIVATNMISTQKVMLELNLNNHSTWELEHMRVADGFTATWSMDATNPTENIARIQIEKTGNAAVTGEAVLVSIPVRLWEWKESEVPANTMTTGELYTPAERWALGLIFKAELSVKIEKGTLILTDGSVVAVNDDDLVVDTELYINSYNRNDTGFFTSNKNSWHIHKIGEPESKEATCTEEGYIDRVFCVGCACGSTEAHDATDGCGAILTWGTSIAAVGHTYKVTGDRIACSCGAALEGSGIVEFEGSLYYMISGKLISGWRNVGYDWYYADPETKKLATGKKTISGETYQFDEEGILILEGDGFVKIDGTTYYYQDGKMFYAGLIEIDGYYYYINSHFEVVTGRNYISKTNDLLDPGYYEFDETGKMIRPVRAELSEKAGTLKITYTENQQYKNIRFAVWSDAKGHDDLHWYAATETAEGKWTYTVDLTKHNTLGEYFIHVYTVESGNYNKLIEHVIHVEKLPEPSGKIVVSDDCATMQITYTADAQNKNIRYAVWSDNGGQDDLYWYKASKNADGNWIYTVNLAAHNTVGKYHIHVYDVTNGVYTKLAEYTANVKKLAPASDNVKVSDDCATMQITNAADAKYKNIHYAVWSDVGGHDDLMWYAAGRTADGKWTYTVNLAVHNTVGKYHIHVYDVTSGVYTKLAEYTANVAKLAPASDNVKVSDNCATMKVTYKADERYKNIYYAVWSDNGGQDDLYWYAARKTAEGKWINTVDLRAHSTVGKYHIHVYDVTAGVYTKLAEYTTVVAQLPPAFDNVKVSDDCETMKILHEAEKLHEHVHFAVWSDAGGQDDLHWYAASKNAEGKWTYTVDLRTHNTAGKYHIHVYGIDGGVYTKLAEYTVDVDQEAKSPVSMSVSGDGNTLTITYTADQQHEHVHYAVWSEANGQDDLQWYASDLSADGKWACTVNLAAHGGSGRYNIHVYAIDGGVYNKLVESVPVL